MSVPLTAEKIFALQNNNFCLQSSKFSVKYFLKPAEINGDRIFYLNGQRVRVRDNFSCIIVTCASFFSPRSS